MKRFAAMLTVAGLAMFAIPGVTSAQDTGYNTPTPTFSDTTPGPGEDFDVGITNCVIDSDVVFTFQGNVQTKTCAAFTPAAGGFAFFATAAPATGSASATFTAPTTPGTYPGTIALTSPDGPEVVSFSITVEGSAAATTTVAPAGGLPATGSSGSSTTVMIASILLLAGLGMFGVAQMRRRQLVA